MSVTVLSGIMIFGLLLLFLTVGFPIAISILLSSLFTLMLILPADTTIFTGAQRLVTEMNSFTMLAIPLFVLAGIIMNNGGIAFKLINFAKVLVGRIPGSLAHTNVVGNMLFGSIAGSSVASAAAMGRIMGPMQENSGYDRKYAAATNIASAPAGLLIPPTSILIVYSLVSGGTSIAALFMAGYIPGILWGVTTMVVAFVFAKKYKYSVSEKISWKDKVYLTLDALPSLMLIVIVIGGIVAGIFTATEGAAIAVIYSTVLAAIYKNLKLKEIPAIMKETIEITGMILLLITASGLFSLVMSYTGLPSAISEGLLSLTDNPVVILLLMNVILLAIGTFMDITPAVLIFTPIFLPIATSMGIDPIHFGIIITFNLCIGNMTPPVGSALFVGASVADIRIEKVIPILVPFFIALFIMLIIVTFIPELSLFLPNLLGLG
ncbi:TRAP transporter large permease subunit [Salinicoccus albus]|uniref:TRAP transporter large permease n=1 Tax=Salinicoccus albus TaxID=418756 RepID=UPI00036E2B09